MSIRSLGLALAVPLVLAACGSSSPPADDTGDDVPPTGPVYYGEVDRILNENCVMCHSADPDRLAPFSLATYADAVDAADNQPVAYEVMNRLMPPYYADDSGACQTFKDNPWLADADIDTLTTWMNTGRAEGDPANASAPPQPLRTLARVDATLDFGTSYTPDPTLTDDYRCFIVDPGNATDMFLTGYEVKPGNPTAVHHMIAFSLATAQAETDAIAKDAAVPGLGWPCIGGTGVTGTQMVGGWAPGGGASLFPTDTGLRIPGARKMIVQMHYNLASADGNPDRTTVDLTLEPSVTDEARIVPVAAPISLPPGQPDVTATGTLRIPTIVPDVTVWSAAIHMHQRGLGGTTLRETTGNSCLIDLVNWSFHWQHSYAYDNPITLHGGQELEVTCHFDTTDDTSQVYWGEGTADEMCIAFLYVTGLTTGGGGDL